MNKSVCDPILLKQPSGTPTAVQDKKAERFLMDHTPLCLTDVRDGRDWFVNLHKWLVEHVNCDHVRNEVIIAYQNFLKLGCFAIHTGQSPRRMIRCTVVRNEPILRYTDGNELTCIFAHISSEFNLVACSLAEID